jgi:2-(1,2-epoxy-1,2-dihydrophenyl)acetyl-CoA isomerase
MREFVGMVVEDGVGLLTLRNPERLNALTPEMRNGLIEALSALYADPSCRAVILTGEGANFCAGGDLSGMADLKGLNGRRRILEGQRLLRSIVEGPLPVIAAVEGFAVGGGLALAAACDHVIAAKSANFRSGFGKIGLIPDMGSAWTLPMRMGLGRARRVLLSDMPLDGAEARAEGLADALCEDGCSVAAAQEHAARLKKLAPGSLALTKAMLTRLDAGLNGMLQAEADLQGLLFSTDDFQEGRTAFLERRSPKFVGR